MAVPGVSRIDYLTVTVAPAASSLVLASSAASLATFSNNGLGAPSTRSLASLRPRPETISRTTLMTPIFLSPAASRITSNSVCSSAASAGAPAPTAPGAGATATGAAAAPTKDPPHRLLKVGELQERNLLERVEQLVGGHLGHGGSFLRWGLGYSAAAGSGSGGVS